MDLQVDADVEVITCRVIMCAAFLRSSAIWCKVDEVNVAVEVDSTVPAQDAPPAPQVTQHGAHHLSPSTKRKLHCSHPSHPRPTKAAGRVRSMSSMLCDCRRHSRHPRLGPSLAPCVCPRCRPRRPPQSAAVSPRTRSPRSRRASTTALLQLQWTPLTVPPTNPVHSEPTRLPFDCTSRHVDPAWPVEVMQRVGCADVSHLLAGAQRLHQRLAGPSTPIALGTIESVSMSPAAC